MLTKEDLQALSDMMDEKINTAIGNSESRMMAYIESHVETEIRQIADGHLMLAEKMDRLSGQMEEMRQDIDEIKGAVTAHDIIITSRYRPAQ